MGHTSGPGAASGFCCWSPTAHCGPIPRPGPDVRPTAAAPPLGASRTISSTVWSVWIGPCPLGCNFLRVAGNNFANKKRESPTQSSLVQHRVKAGQQCHKLQQVLPIARVANRQLAHSPRRLGPAKHEQ